MDETPPFEQLFDQMNDLLKLLQGGAGKKINQDAIPLDIEARLKKLEKDVEAFEKLGEKAVELSGLSSVEVRKHLEGMSEDTTPEGKAIIEKAKHLKSQAEALEESYKTGIMSPPPTEKIVDDPKYGKNRRKKFKRFGGDDTWKPL